MMLTELNDLTPMILGAFFLIAGGLIFFAILFGLTNRIIKTNDIENSCKYRLFPVGENKYIIHELGFWENWETFNYIFEEHVRGHLELDLYSLEEGKKMVEKIKESRRKRIEDIAKRREEVEKKTVYL